MVLAGCGERRPAELPAHAPPIDVRELSARQPRAVGATAGAAGDFVIEGTALRALVGGMRRRPGDRGKVLAIETIGAPPSDDFDSLAAVLYEGEVEHDLRVRSVERTVQRSRAGVRVRASMSSGAEAIEITRTITIADVESALAVSTRARGRVEGIALGERVAWGGQSPFVPFVGRIDEEQPQSAKWIGAESAERSIAIGFRDGGGRVRASVRAHAGHDFLRATDLTTPLRADGRSVRVLVSTSRRGLADAVRRLGWARGQPYPEATVSLSRTTPRAALRVMRASDGAPWLRSRLARDEALAGPLPHGREPMLVRATAYGHDASEAVPIEPGATLRLDIPPAGQIRVRAIDDATGEPIPFRARVRSLAPTEQVDLGPIWSAAGARDIAASPGAPIELSVPLGEHEIVVTHGPEWSLETRRVVVGVHPIEIEARLRHEADPGEWVASDFHLHAAPSPDSQVTLEDRVTSLIAEGVRFAVPTDHNTVTDYAPAIASLEAALGTVPGVEVTTWEPAVGHFHAFPVPLDPAAPRNGAPEFTGLTPEQLFASVRRAAPGALLQVNHPRLEPGIGYFDVVGFDPATGEAEGPYSADYDAIEVWNGFDLARPANVERNLAEWMALLARRGRAVATGNSDSHTIRTEWAGYPRTYVRSESGPDDADALLSSLRLGRAFVTNGPLLELSIDDRGPGDTVELHTPRVRIAVGVRAASWIDVDTVDLYVGTAIAATLSIPPRRRPDRPLRFRGRVELEITEPTFVIAVARGEAPMQALFARRDVRPFAFTNPIWLVPP